ncbi:DELLA protein 1-like [Prosopis cineraria]|uniref:DELLA protein 1-like n=1 Tax=Prosopis cineraria TaxID=364024 RepID=UPI00240F7809|nr:DELLA protein 1-like [Prosopis cineraria]
MSEEENRDVELAQFLLTAEERKIIYYVSRALRERIHKEKGMISTLDGYKKTERHEFLGKIDSSLSFVSTCFQKTPFRQVMQITSIQAITEHLASGTKIHVIDLEIRCGVQWTALMQALVGRRERPLQLLKITAIGFRGRIELGETSECLANFAESLNLPFSFKAVFVTDMIEIKEQHIEVDDDEAVAVYAPYVLSTMIPMPECLENLMSMRKKKPCIMAILES